MDFTTRYNKLNKKQKEAVDCIDGPVMVIAGPGTGKTELLSMRTANILRKTDILPNNILCLTFTESGATAMRQRLSQIIGPSAYKVAIHTFHSFGSEIINQNSEYFYNGANFRPADDLGRHKILCSIFDNLKHDNPLSPKTNDQYTHLNDALTIISEIKRSGLSSDELAHILDVNDKATAKISNAFTEIFSERPSKSTLSKLSSLIPKIQAIDSHVSIPGITPLTEAIGNSLERALEEAEEIGKTIPITSWRNKWMRKDDKNSFVLRSRAYSKKLRSMCSIYSDYLEKMHEAELYDFDDMILKVVHAMEVFPDLRFDLQERYQYIMVDEFQDTNMAQMRILNDLTSNETNDGQPNILVVGDDDQAIYSFQGADVGNIHNFRELFQNIRQITLVDNYRSSNIVLERARDVITISKDRLENIIPGLDKTLTAHQKEEGTVTLTELPNTTDERLWLANKINDLLSKGAEPSSIAVLARKHHELVSLLPYFAEKKIKVNYEKKDNVLEMDIIVIINLISSIIIAITEQRHKDVDTMLPKLLAHPAFSMTAEEIWKLSLESHKSHRSWMEVMSETDNLKPLHLWLIEIAKDSVYSPLEQILDGIIGAPKDTDGSKNNSFISPLYNYYFSKDRLKKEPDAYLSYLEALRKIRALLKDYKPDEQPTIKHLTEFIDYSHQLGSVVTSSRPRTSLQNEAVNLMTAHKSKGLEFDNVFIIGAIDSTWGENVRSHNKLIKYPENLPLAPAGDTFDERLRLFFVAMTRAKHNLYISYSLAGDNGKSTLPSSFLVDERWQTDRPTLSSNIEELVHEIKLDWYQPIISPINETLKNLLSPTLENYKLSSTHLNNFLDISRGGPNTFLTNNLLRFPQAISPNAAYGSAIHSTLQQIHSYLKANNKMMDIDQVKDAYKEALKNQHMSDLDFEKYTEKGFYVLESFLEKKQDHFNTRQKVELNFANQSVFVGKAHLTGSLDLIDFNENSVIVTDYKTGSAPLSWKGKTDYEKIKLHKYEQQLMFYNLLIQNSRDYSKYTMEKGTLQFVEPTESGEIVALSKSFDKEQLDRLSILIQAVWQHITSLNFPDIDKYEKNYSGMIEFENDLIENFSSNFRTHHPLA